MDQLNPFSLKLLLQGQFIQAAQTKQNKTMNRGHQILLLLKTVMTQANEDKSQLNIIVFELGWHQFMLIQLFSHFFIKINNAATYSFVYKLFSEISYLASWIAFFGEMHQYVFLLTIITYVSFFIFEENKQ